jgi:hypothetical protein
MILTNRFVFIHVPRTGGTFVRRLFLHSAPSSWGAQILEGHPTVRDIPPPFDQLPRIAVVRNPFDWYVSWYHYMVQIGGNPVFEDASAGGKLGFRQTILALLKLQPIHYFPSNSGNGPGDRLCFTWYFHFLLGRLDQVRILRFETLRRDLESALSETVSLTEEFRAALRSDARANVSEHGDFRDYYDRELRLEIENCDAELLDHFSYRW